MSADARAEARRLYSYDGSLPAAVESHRAAFVAGAEWVDAQRQPLTDATHERLVDLVANEVAEAISNMDAGEKVADAIIAEFRPVATTRERLAEALFDLDHKGLTFAEAAALPGPFNEGAVLAIRNRVDRLLASGAVADRAEVEAKALEDAATLVEDHRWDTTDDTAAAIRARAAGIREGRS